MAARISKYFNRGPFCELLGKKPNLDTEFEFNSQFPDRICKNDLHNH